MRSSFTAVALALGIVTMTALPAMALTLKENPFDEVGAQAPDDGVLAPGSETMGVLIENKGDPTAARSGPAGALPDTSAAMGVVIEYKPAEFNPGAQTAVESKSGGQVPGSETGIIGDLPAPVPAAIAIPNLLPARASANEASGNPTELKPAGLSPPKIGARLLTPGSETGIIIENLPAPASELVAPMPAMSLDQQLDAQMGLLPDISQSPGAALPAIILAPTARNADGGPGGVGITLAPTAGNVDEGPGGSGIIGQQGASPRIGQQMQKVAPGQQISPAVKTMEATRGLTQ